MPFTFTDTNKKYIIIKIRGDEKVILFLKKLGIIEGKVINNIANNESGFIAIINNEVKVALDKNIASKIIVEEYKQWHLIKQKLEKLW